MTGDVPQHRDRAVVGPVQVVHDEHDGPSAQRRSRTAPSRRAAAIAPRRAAAPARTTRPALDERPERRRGCGSVEPGLERLGERVVREPRCPPGNDPQDEGAPGRDVTGQLGRGAGSSRCRVRRTGGSRDLGRPRRRPGSPGASPAPAPARRTGSVPSPGRSGRSARCPRRPQRRIVREDRRLQRPDLRIRVDAQLDGQGLPQPPIRAESLALPALAYSASIR